MTRKWAFLMLLPLLLLVLPSSGALAQSTDLSSSFTYQGYLSGATGPVNLTCDFQFGLFDALNAGTQVGSTQTKTSVAVNNGVFNVVLDFGASAFNGTDRYLNIEVRCPAGSGGYTTLTPRQTITAAPYALGLYGLQVQQNATSPNLIGGFSSNNVIAGVVGAVISGGGLTGATNRVTDNYGVVSGGGNNQAGNNTGTTNDARFATISGGSDNIAGGLVATIGGGANNIANNSFTTVSGGAGNTSSGDTATVSGGFNNVASGQYAAIGGGNLNIVSVFGGTIAGGAPTDLDAPGSSNNRVLDNYGVISGGGDNLAGNGTGTLVDAAFATVGGGVSNEARGLRSTVSGGSVNLATGDTSTVAGGGGNTASGAYSVVVGGANNTASGDFSFASGRQAKATNDGIFVWADSTNADFNAGTLNSFVARASGGVVFFTNAAATVGAQLPAGSGSWALASDRNLKQNIDLVDPRYILESVVNLPITTWNYNAQDASIRHIGPMAQDFYATFGVGEDDKHISTVDADGVALAAIQGLYQVVQDKDAQISTLQTENSALKTRVDDLDQRLAALEALALPSQAGMGNPLMWVVLAAVGFCVFGWRSLKKGHPA